MYAVVEIGGHQYRVSEGDRLFVDRQGDSKDQNLTFNRVLMFKDDEGKIIVGKPVIEGATVKALLLDNIKADKVIVFKKKRRKGYRVKRGHRQPMSQIEIESISVSGAKKTKSKTAKKSAAPKAKQKAAPEVKKKATPKTTKKAAPKTTKKAAPKTTKKAAPKTKQKKETEKTKQKSVSTDMNASEAIDHINNTPLKQLKGFVTDNEKRVTVLRAWESKQE